MDTTLDCDCDDTMMTFGYADAQEEEEPGHHHHHVRGQRQYEFAVEVTAGPPNSVFRHTKVITVKSKYIVENQTGMPIEIKQRGTPDLDVLQYGSTAHGRCARRLEVNERCAPCLRAMNVLTGCSLCKVSQQVSVVHAAAFSAVFVEGTCMCRSHCHCSVTDSYGHCQP